MLFQNKQKNKTILAEHRMSFSPICNTKHTYLLNIGYICELYNFISFRWAGFGAFKAQVTEDKERKCSDRVF